MTISFSYFSLKNKKTTNSYTIAVVDSINLIGSVPSEKKKWPANFSKLNRQTAIQLMMIRFSAKFQPTCNMFYSQFSAFLCLKIIDNGIPIYLTEFVHFLFRCWILSFGKIISIFYFAGRAISPKKWPPKKFIPTEELKSITADWVESKILT